MTTTKKQLWAIYTNSESDLFREVVMDVLDNCEEDKDIDIYLQQVVSFGGVNAGIPNLIYHTECEVFAKRHLTEILDIYNETREFIDPKEEINADYLAWMAYQYICAIILDGTPIEDYHM